jgi:hypothetical protein
MYISKLQKLIQRLNKIEKNENSYASSEGNQSTKTISESTSSSGAIKNSYFKCEYIPVETEEIDEVVITCCLPYKTLANLLIKNPALRRNITKIKDMGEGMIFYQCRELSVDDVIELSEKVSKSDSGWGNAEVEDMIKMEAFKAIKQGYRNMAALVGILTD